MKGQGFTRRGLVGLLGAAAAGAGTSWWSGPDSLDLQQGAVGWVRRVEGAGDSLRQIDPRERGRLQIVAGYHAPGDGGGGAFRWDASSVDPDDGGITIASSLPGLVGRWKRLLHDNSQLSVRWFGAAGDGSDDRDAIARAATTAGEAGIYFPPGSYAVGSDLELLHSVKFEEGATLIPGVGVTVTLEGPISAEPRAACFDTGSGGLVVAWEGEVLANWWSGADFSEQWNRCVASIDRGVTGVGPRAIAVVGHQTCTGSLDLTGFRRPTLFDFSRATLSFDLAGGVAVDMTDSVDATVVDLSVDGQGGVALLLSRDENTTGPRGAGRHVFRNLQVTGDWSVAAVYNIGSEVNRFHGGNISNESASAKYTLFLGKRNVDGVTSAFGVAPGNGTPPTTATGQELFGIQIRGVNLPTVDGAGVVTVYGFSNVVTYGIFLTSSFVPHIYIDHSEFGVRTLELVDVFTHGGQAGTAKPPASIQTGGDPDQIVARLRVDARRIQASDWAIDIGTTDLRAPEFNWYENVGLRCDPTAEMRSAVIRVAANLSTPIQLGWDFHGEIHCGNSSTVTPATNSMQGTVFATDGVFRYTPERILSRSGAPPTAPGQGVLWVSDGTSHNDGDLLVTITDSSGTAKTVKLVDFPTA